MFPGRIKRFVLATSVALVVNGLILLAIMHLNAFVRGVDPPVEEDVLLEFADSKRELPPNIDPVRSPRAQAQAVIPIPIPDLSTNLPLASPLIDMVGDVDVMADRLGKEGGNQLNDQDLIAQTKSNSSLYTPPEEFEIVMPEYPTEAKGDGIEGHVELKFKVSPQGIVEKIWVLDSKPPGVFDAAAQAALLRSRFSPATYRGKSVSSYCTKLYNFILEK